MSKRRRAATCIYCGVPIAAGRTCAAHRALERADPNESELRRPLTERELGLVVPWPEGEAGDDDAAA